MSFLRDVAVLESSLAQKQKQQLSILSEGRFVKMMCLLADPGIH
jgi:hypothetical protein